MCVYVTYKHIMEYMWKTKGQWGGSHSSSIMGSRACMASALIAKSSCQPKSCILKNVTLFLHAARSFVMSIYL